MRKEDMTVASALLEAMTIILGIAYIGLQITYGIRYHIPPHKYMINIISGILVYMILTLLSYYPERVHKFPDEIFTSEVRKLTLWMLQLIKFVFIASLLIPCFFDLFGIQIQEATSLIVVGLIILIIVIFESRIIRRIRQNRK